MALVYCRRCRTPASNRGRCPNCGSRDPGGLTSALYGVFAYGTLVAFAVTGTYAYAISLVWERWIARFDRLPPDDPWSGHAVEAAYGIGISVFLVSWFLFVFILSRHVLRAARQSDRRLTRS